MKKISQKWLSYASKTVKLAMALVVMVVFTGCELLKNKELTYAPWTDLSHHFDLTKVECKGGLGHFNSSAITMGKELILSEHIGDRQYNATVLGTGVCVRSRPQVSPRTQVCQVNTGDHLFVVRSVGYVEGKYWSYIRVLSGRSAGYEGYICTDFLIEQAKYDVLQNYVFSSRSNISIETDSKYLNAIAVALLKFNVHKLHPNLYIRSLDTAYTGTHHIVTYQIRDNGIHEGNHTMLVFVQFDEISNDFAILGIVPGVSVENVTRCADGSHDISFNLIK